MNVDAYGNTDIGLVRERNEDALWLDDEHGFYVVADGIGGLPDGNIASRMAVKLFRDRMDALPSGSIPDIHRLFDEINQGVVNYGFRRYPDSGIGTTLTGVILAPEHLWVGHIGDCVLFRCRGGELEQITTEHTIAEELKGHFHEHENIELPEYFFHTLTQCIGQQEHLNTEVLQLTIRSGDRYIICSDGISKSIPQEDIGLICEQADNARSCVARLLSEALNYGGVDNATAICLFVSL
ncbi:MAG: serine/threonine-protein phosphatase [Opitutales bacterium]|nr:serine/threonine-protein phosphatase [Opitutales bacterium]